MLSERLDVPDVAPGLGRRASSAVLREQHGDSSENDLPALRGGASYSCRPIPPMKTFIESLAMMSDGPTQTAMSLARAASPPSSTVRHPMDAGPTALNFLRPASGNQVLSDPGFCFPRSSLWRSSQATYGLFFTSWRLRSGAPSVHHTGPRSPSATLPWSTAFRARASASSSPDWTASRTALRAVMSRSTQSFRTSGGSAGLAARHSRPRTTR